MTISVKSLDNAKNRAEDNAGNKKNKLKYEDKSKKNKINKIKKTITIK